jgi:hypothetical protein
MEMDDETIIPGGFERRETPIEKEPPKDEEEA